MREKDSERRAVLSTANERLASGEILEVSDVVLSWRMGKVLGNLKEESSEWNIEYSACERTNGDKSGLELIGITLRLAAVMLWIAKWELLMWCRARQGVVSRQK